MIAVQTKLLSLDEATTEKNILLHFASKLSPLIEEGAVKVASFKRRIILETEKIRPLVRRLLRFAEIRDTVKVPVFLVTNPEEGSGGGEANAGRIVLEVQAQPGYSSARAEVMPSGRNLQQEVSEQQGREFHQLTRLREKVMRRFKSAGHARFLEVFGIITSHFRVARHL